MAASRKIADRHGAGLENAPGPVYLMTGVGKFPRDAVANVSVRPELDAETLAKIKERGYFERIVLGRKP